MFNFHLSFLEVKDNDVASSLIFVSLGLEISKR